MVGAERVGQEMSLGKIFTGAWRASRLSWVAWKGRQFHNIILNFSLPVETRSRRNTIAGHVLSLDSVSHATVEIPKRRLTVVSYYICDLLVDSHHVFTKNDQVMTVRLN